MRVRVRGSGVQYPLVRGLYRAADRISASTSEPRAIEPKEQVRARSRPHQTGGRQQRHLWHLWPRHATTGGQQSPLNQLLTQRARQHANVFRTLLLPRAASVVAQQGYLALLEPIRGRQVTLLLLTHTGERGLYTLVMPMATPRGRLRWPAALQGVRLVAGLALRGTHDSECNR